MEPLEIARRVAEIATDKQGVNTVLLDTHGVCSFADYFVLTSGESERQIDAIRDAIVEDLKKQDVRPHHEEGNATSGWVLLDYGSVIVHIFSPAEREFYDLDKLWAQAPALLRVQ